MTFVQYEKTDLPISLTSDQFNKECSAFLAYHGYLVDPALNPSNSSNLTETFPSQLEAHSGLVR